MINISRHQTIAYSAGETQVIGFRYDNVFYVTAKTLAIAAGYKPNIVFYYFESLPKFYVQGNMQSCLTFAHLLNCKETFTSKIPFDVIQWIANNSNISKVDILYNKRPAHKCPDVWANEHIYLGKHKIRYFEYEGSIYFVTRDLLACAGYKSSCIMNYHFKCCKSFNVHSASSLAGNRASAIRYCEWNTYKTEMQYQLPEEIRHWMLEVSLADSDENEIVVEYPRPDIVFAHPYKGCTFRLFPYEKKLWFVASDILKMFGYGSRVRKLSYNSPNSKQFLIKFNRAFQKMYCWTIEDIADVSLHLKKPFPKDFLAVLKEIESKVPVEKTKPVEFYEEESKRELLKDLLIYYAIPDETIPPLMEDIEDIYSNNRLIKKVIS